jgi:hypothetical protein
MAHLLTVPVTARQKEWILQLSEGHAERWAYGVLLQQAKPWQHNLIRLETDGLRQTLPNPPVTPPGQPRNPAPNAEVLHRREDLETEGLEEVPPLAEGQEPFTVRIPDAVWPILVDGLALQNLWNQTTNDNLYPGQHPVRTFATLSEWAHEHVMNALAVGRIGADRSLRSAEQEELYPGVAEPETHPKAPPAPRPEGNHASRRAARLEALRQRRRRPVGGPSTAGDDWVPPSVRRREGGSESPTD